MTTPAKYDPVKVGSVLLYEVIEHHPACLTADELTRRIVADPGDAREVKTATKAIGELRESGLVRGQDDEVLEPTRAALHAHALFTAR